MRMSDWSSDLCSSVQGKDGTDIMLTEINFDGIIGPTHNYAGLSRGNIASASNAGGVSQPRAAALQGLEKMRRNLALGLPQGFFVPLERPDAAWLGKIGSTSCRDRGWRSGLIPVVAGFLKNKTQHEQQTDTKQD